MRRAIVAGLCALAAAAPGAALAPLSLDQVFVGVAAEIAAGAAGVPSPPTTKEEKKALKAWTVAGKAVDKALVADTPKGYTRAGKKVEKTLRRAFPEDPTVDGLLDGFASGVVGGTIVEVVDLEAQILELPPGDDRDFLLGLLDPVQDLVDQAAAAETPSEAHNLCASVARILGAIEKKYNRALKKAVGAPGLSALVDGAPYAAAFVEGSIATGAGGSGVKELAVVGILFDGVNSESIVLRIDLTGTGSFVVPGTYAIAVDGAEGGYTRTGAEGFEEVINGEAGTLTLVAIDPVAGTASGFFEFTGPNLMATTGSVSEGRFNATNLIVTVLDE